MFCAHQRITQPLDSPFYSFLLSRYRDRDVEDEAKELVKEVFGMMKLLGRIKLSLKASRWGEEGRVGVRWLNITTATSSTGSTSPPAIGDRFILLFSAIYNHGQLICSSQLINLPQQGGASSICVQPRPRSCRGKQTGPILFCNLFFPGKFDTCDNNKVFLWGKW